MARSCSGSWFPLCRAGHQLKSCRRSICAKAGRSLRKDQEKLPSEVGTCVSQADTRAVWVLLFSFVFVSKSPDHSLSAAWLHGGDVPRKARREVSSASPGLRWGLEESARSVFVLTPWWMQGLSRALHSLSTVVHSTNTGRGCWAYWYSWNTKTYEWSWDGRVSN